MALELGSLGEEMTLKIKQGSDFGPFPTTMKNPDGSAMNLTGMIFRGHIRKKASDTAIVATFTCTITNAAAGQWEFGLSAAVTTALTAGATINSGDSKYVWDMEYVDSSSKVRPLWYGTAYVFREVTK